MSVHCTLIVYIHAYVRWSYIIFKVNDLNRVHGEVYIWHLADSHSYDGVLGARQHPVAKSMFHMAHHSDLFSLHCILYHRQKSFGIHHHQYADDTQLYIFGSKEDPSVEVRALNNTPMLFMTSCHTMVSDSTQPSERSSESVLAQFILHYSQFTWLPWSLDKMADDMRSAMPLVHLKALIIIIQLTFFAMFW